MNTPPADASTAPASDRSALLDRPLSSVRAAALGRRSPVLSAIPVGTVDAAAIADVDPAGWVHPRGATWSLDWWIGAEDRWHHPSVEAAVRQRTLGSSPVVETSMRVPGGDVTHRAFGVRATSRVADGAMWDDSAVVVEVENATAVPVALAFVVRPLTLSGPGAVSAVEVDGSIVRIDGRVAMVVSRPVSRVAHGALGEPAGALVAGDDTEPTVAITPVDGDRLEVALVVPLPHTAVVRVLVPRVAASGRRRWFGPRNAPPGEPGATFDAPGPDAISSGWSMHTGDAARVDLGEPALDDLVTASQRSLVLGSADHVMARADRAVQVTELLARSGLTEPLGPIARALVDAQRMGGAVVLGDGGDATAALLFAAAPLLASGAAQWEELLVGPVAKSVHLVGKGGALADPGSLSSGAAALALVAPALRAVGQPEVAQDAAEAARSRREATRPGADAPRPAPEDDLLGALVALRRRIAGGDADAVASLVDFARLGERSAVADRYDDHGVPSGTLGYDPGAVAARAAAVLDLAVRDDTLGPALLPAWPVSWWGRNLDVHLVRTRWGSVSFGLRWHGARPAILWEVLPGPGVDPDAAPVLTCPGLDPAWRGEGWSGDALLAEVAAPEGLVDHEPMAPSITRSSIDLSAPSEGESFS